MWPEPQSPRLPSGPVLPVGRVWPGGNASVGVKHGSVTAAGHIVGLFGTRRASSGSTHVVRTMAASGDTAAALPRTGTTAASAGTYAFALP